MKRNSYYILAAAVILSFFVLTEARAQGYGDRNQAANGPDSGRYAIQGKVIMPDGTPAKQVKVTYNSTSAASGSSETNDEGIFRINNIPSGNYTVTVKIEGLPASNENFTISREGSQGQAYNVVIYMRVEGQKKGAPVNPMLKDVPKEAVGKFEKAMEKASDPKGALLLLDEAIAAYPQFALAYYEKGLLYQKQNDLDNALTSFGKAIEIKPDFIEAKMNYGQTLLAMGSYELALQVFQDVIKQKNDIPAAYSSIGVALAGMNKLDMAEKAFKYALAMKGGENLAAPHRYLGRIYMQNNRNAEAIAEFEKYLQLLPKAADAEKVKADIETLKKKV
jgi:Tfp pilus assembly protein PilF